MLKTERILKAGVVAGAIVVAFAFTPGLRAQSYLTSEEATSRALVNQARSAAGLGTLADVAGLDAVARAQAVRMAERGAPYHNPNLDSDVDAAGVNWKWLGENVGTGFDITSIHRGFMASPEHHQNIVYAPYNAIGVGVVAGQNGAIYVAHVFADVIPGAVVVRAASVSQPKPAPAVHRMAAASPAASTQRALASRSSGAPVHAQAGPAATRHSTSTPTPNALAKGIVNLGVVFGSSHS